MYNRYPDGKVEQAGGYTNLAFREEFWAEEMHL